MAESPRMVSLPTMRDQTYDLSRLNIAMDAILQTGSEDRARYALLHKHDWPATDAVLYTRAAQSCFDNMIDPNDLDG